MFERMCTALRLFNLSQVYHSVMSKYLPKRLHVQFEHMQMGTLLSALDNNYNAGRQQKVTILPGSKPNSIKIKRHFHVAYRKASKKFIARKAYERKNYSFKKEIMSRSRERASLGLKNLVHKKRKCMSALIECPSRSDLIERATKFCHFK